jgi:predicted short-subunit dehydrogenase-like oxidoreductase (DUF2520 family)
VISRTEESARRLAEETDAARSSSRLADTLASHGALILAVPDDIVPSLAQELSLHGPGWEGRTVFHLSGSLSSSSLDPLKARGAEVASFHPMLPLRPDSSPDVFSGAWISVEGTEAACALGRRLAETLGSRPVVVTARTKSVIHLVAAIASNYLVTLMTLASDVLAGADLEPDTHDALFRPLVTTTLANIDFADPSRALTGPISRGDTQTVRNHLQLVREQAPEYLAVLAALMAETVRVASRSGRITDEKAEEMLDLLQEAVGPESF